MKELQGLGVAPDLIVLRCDRPLDKAVFSKNALFCNVRPDCVIENRTLESLYEAPLMLEQASLAQAACRRLMLEVPEPDLWEWEELVDRIAAAEDEVRIGLVGKYVELHDAYLSVAEALRHAGYAHGVRVEIDWVDSGELNAGTCARRLSGLDGIIVPGGFESRGVEGMVAAARYARETSVPFLGISWGCRRRSSSSPAPALPGLHRRGVRPLAGGRMTLAHNGNLSNADELRCALELAGAIFHTTSDTETIAYLVTRKRLRCPSIEDALSAAMDEIAGAYSLVLMSPQKLICARDPHGFRPLCYGVTDEDIYVVASENCALAAVGARFLRDIDSGEIIVFTAEGPQARREHCQSAPRASCVFEYIYFARPDSGLDAALGYARASGIPWGMGLVRNRYVKRTFISPGQSARLDKVRLKLAAMGECVRGWRVVLVDDSIVRGVLQRALSYRRARLRAEEPLRAQALRVRVRPCSERQAAAGLWRLARGASEEPSGHAGAE